MESLLRLGFWVAFIGGWIANIVKLAQADTVTGFELARIVGIFIAPLGSILGFC